MIGRTVLRCLAWGVGLALAGFLQAAPSSASRNMRLGVSVAQFVDNEIGPAHAPLMGFVFRYEFVMSPRFNLGIHTSYRYAQNDRHALHQFVYGLILQHYLGAREAALPIYLSYGLLLQVALVNKVEGHGTAHDTRLAVGTDFDWLGYKNFSELAYHYSRLHYFSTTSHSLDHVELVYGMRI